MLLGFWSKVRGPACLSALLLAVSCGGSTTPTPPPPPPPPPPPAPVPTTIAIEAGNQQSAAGGEAVAVAPAVVVRDQQGNPLPGATVTFSVAEGAGSVEGGSPATDNAGIARVTRWTLGPAGTQRLTARVGTLDPVTFQATILPGTELLDVGIPPGGGSFEISQADHPLRGFRLTIASGVLEAAATWRFRVAPPGSAPTLPSGYQVAGPMLEVATEQARANGLIVLDVPLTLGPNQGAVVALYDPVRRILDVLPTVARTSTSIRAVTRHLRGDFLAGPGQPASAPAASSMLFGGGLLLPISFPLPMPDVPLLIDPESDRWPVLEHGSALAPNGHGPAIAGFEALNLALKGPAFASFVKGLAEPGFYAEPAPIGALLIATKRLSEGLGAALKALNEELRKLPKPERDELVSHTMSAAMALRGATPVAFASATDEQMAFAMGGGITGSGLSVVTAAKKGVLVVGRTPTAGFEPQSVTPTVDSPPKVADGVLPLSSLILAFDRLGDILSKLQSLPSLPPEARALVNQALAKEAGLPDVELEAQVGSDGGWVGVKLNKLIRRVKAVTIRTPTLVAGMMLHIPTGAEMARSTEPRLDLAPVAPLNELPPLTPTPVVFSPFATIGGKLKQITALIIDMVRADFEVTPERVTLGGDRKVSFEAAVPEPPSSGYRVRWEWGDGETTENLGLPNATHTYETLGSFRVVTTLLSQPEGKVLAADTVMVDRPEPAPYWRIETIADPDSLFDPDPASNDLGRLYQRLLLEPKSTLIVIENVGSGSVVRLRVLPTSTWSLTSCCPTVTPLPGELRVSHGVKPPTVATFGAAFGAWTRSEWSQTSESLDTGTLTGRFVLGSTTYSMQSGGSQTGPTGVTRIEATRSGDRMNGTLFITTWFVDDETGFVDDEPTTWRLPFTAVRIQ